MRTFQNVSMIFGAYLAALSLFVLFPIGDPDRFVGHSALRDGRTDPFTLEGNLNCTSLGLQQAGFAIDRFWSSKNAGHLSFARGAYDGRASVTMEPNGYRFEVLANLFDQPRADFDAARALARSAFDAVATSCDVSGDVQVLCVNADCRDGKRNNHAQTIAFIAEHVSASTHYMFER